MIAFILRVFQPLNANVWAVRVVHFAVNHIVCSPLDQCLISVMFVALKARFFEESAVPERLSKITSDVGDQFIDLLPDGRLVAVQAGDLFVGVRFGQGIGPVP